MNFKKALILLLVILPGIGRSQEVRIRLQNCTLDQETLSRIQHSFSFQVDFYKQVFQDKSINSITAKVFGTEKEFVRYAKDHASFNPVRNHSIAFYSPRLKEMILHKEVDDLPAVFAHEISHALMDHYCTNASIWLDEGLAELLEDIRLDQDTAFYFDLGHLQKIQDARTLLEEGSSVSEAVFSSNFYRDPGSRNYTLSWAAVTYLYKANPDILLKMIKGDCGAGEDVLLFFYPAGSVLFDIDVRSFFLNILPNPD